MLFSFSRPRHDTPANHNIYHSGEKIYEQCYGMKTNKRAKQKKKYTQRERAGANDIIFIFVNEFRTHKKKLLTSAVLYYFSVSRCRQSNLLFTRKTWEDADEHKRRLTKLNENQINKKKAISLDFISILQPKAMKTNKRIYRFIIKSSSSVYEKSSHRAAFVCSFHMQRKRFAS